MCRSPHGERGLKYWSPVQFIIQLTSLSSRRAWIEINSKKYTPFEMLRRSPHGERGLKWQCLKPLNGLYLVALLTESVD